MINLSWDDAKRYATWLSKVAGKTYRLLSEAEWEYAARAKSQTAYSWGDEIGKHKANCDDCGSEWDRQTAPVGSFAPNAFGLYDMQGNVAEWVEDIPHTDYDGAPVDGSAWTAEENCNSCGGKVVIIVKRGGSYRHPPQELRSGVPRLLAQPRKWKQQTSASASRGRLTLSSLPLCLLDLRRSPGRSVRFGRLVEAGICNGDRRGRAISLFPYGRLMKCSSRAGGCARNRDQSVSRYGCAISGRASLIHSNFAISVSNLARSLDSVALSGDCSVSRTMMSRAWRYSTSACTVLPCWASTPATLAWRS